MQMVNRLATLLFALALAPACHALEWEDATARPTGFVEAGISLARLSAQQEDWSDQYIRGNFALNTSNRLSGELSHQDHFGDEGLFIGAGYAHDFNERWYGSLHIGGSDGGFFLPGLRIDGFINRKWLAARNLVTTVGYTYYRAKDIYTDHTLVLGGLYYFETPWILELGARLNESDPGNIHSSRGFIALTQGKDKSHYLTIRHEIGREAYQLIASNTPVSDFSSHETSLTWRQWLVSNGGFHMRLMHYDNPSYTRNGIELGVFRDF